MTQADRVNITPRKPASEFLIQVNRLQIPHADTACTPGGNQLSPEPQISASQSDVDRRTLMNVMIVGAAAIASVTAGRSAKAALAASEPAPVVALIEAHKLAQANLRAAEAVSSAVDRDL